MKIEEVRTFLEKKKNALFIKVTESEYLNGFEEGQEAIVDELLALLGKEGIKSEEK